MTRPLNTDQSYAIKTQFGSYNTRNLTAFYMDGFGDFSYLIEGGMIATDGFKELDNGDDTGFEKSDFMVKMGYDLSGQQRIEIKAVRAQ